MEKSFIGHQTIYLKSVDSTNSYAYKAFRSGAIDSGTVVVADFQTHGKGQREKSWLAESGANLLVSITADLNIWKIKNLVSINHIVALSIHDFLRQHTKNVFIKWPNDIMVAEKKIAGILIEAQISSTTKKAIIGFGININQDSFDAPRATSLFLENQEKYNPKEFISELIGIFNDFIRLYQEKGAAYLHQLFNQQLWKLNENHVFEINGIKKTGEVISSTMDGQLIVRHSNHEHPYSNGEVKY